jgi:myo-inositol 2-dehydrogenase/D-chiro-inositol 1-dehydrogenase
MADLAIGVIGTGGMGTRHAHNIHRHVAGAQVVGLYDLDQARAGQVAEEVGGAQVFSDPLQLIQDASVEAIVIVSPDPTHAEFVHACLRSQKPVLCEKPLATSLQDPHSIIDADVAI